MPGRRPYRPPQGGNRGGGRRDQNEERPAYAQTAVVEAPKNNGPVQLPVTLTVHELAERLKLNGIDVIKQLMRQGVMASLTQAVDYATAAQAATQLGFQPSPEKAAATQDLKTIHDRALESREGGALLTRPPVVTILGHVDHGKTSLLDAIRETRVAEGEAGGITQHIGAYQVQAHNKPITFLDTPGHEAFTAMRARGAQGADIAVLVVAADDGLMPQTIEAINHAKAAGVPLVVAINKIDKQGANIDRVKGQLVEQGLMLEEYGGEVITVPVSAKTKQGVSDLLDNILVVAEVADLKADPTRAAAGVVIEAHVDRNRGPVATLLVQNGTLKVGDNLVAGDAWGRVKALLDDRGARLRTAGPSTPVEVLGLNILPQAGDPAVAFADDRTAREFVAARQEEQQRARTISRAPVLTMSTVAGKEGELAVKELPLVLKTDVQGSVDPLRSALERVSTAEARVRVLHAAAGAINESDILLASASRALVIGFNAPPTVGARSLAEQNGVEIREYDIIYTAVEDMEKALQGILPAQVKETIEGHARVQQVFPAGRHNKAAGCLVTDGRATRGATVRVMRGRQTVGTVPLQSLKRFKDDAREVAAGLECGITLDGFNDFQPNDVLEFFRVSK